MHQILFILSGFIIMYGKKLLSKMCQGTRQKAFLCNCVFACAKHLLFWQKQYCRLVGLGFALKSLDDEKT